MSQSKYAGELCTLLVDEAYGELTSRIFAVLLRRGRLSIPMLVQYSRLSTRQLRHGLAVLIQQNLVYHHFDEDVNATYYEANQSAAYNLVRLGKILEIVASRYGTEAEDVMQNILRLGHVKISDLADAYISVEEHVNGNNEHNGTNGSNSDAHRNGSSGTPIKSAAQLDSVLYELLEAGFIEPVVPNLFMSPSDIYSKVEREVLQLHFGGSTKGVKQKDELKRKVQDRLQALITEGKNWRPAGNKRAPNFDSNGVNGNTKRRRLSNGAEPTNGHHIYEDHGVRLDRSLILRVNYEKFAVALRNQRLAELVSDRIGEATSYVYAELLRLLEERIPRCKRNPDFDDMSEAPDGPTITTMELAVAISNTIDIGSGIGKAAEDMIDKDRFEKTLNGKRKRNYLEAEAESGASSDEDETEDDHADQNGHENGVGNDSDTQTDDPSAKAQTSKSSRRGKVTFQDRPGGGTAQDRQNKVMQLRNHLMLLAGDSHRFIRKCGSRGEGEWTVDFEPLVDYLKETELDTILLECFGRTGHRLARILRKLGKLDEKHFPTLALMKQKDVRTKLVEMQMAGVVDVQEVPRDNNRTPARTIFLWYFDTDRVYSIMLERIYKTMSRLFQRIQVERCRSDQIQALAERTDVRGHEEGTLSDVQLKELRKLRAKEELLLAQVGRLDELVGIFQDY
ncbi:DNA directed RNA polymerase-like protein III subunit Rpc82 [Xylogone sp. PMI_703]|nr:DNA directed RNA polymerase-like protein III subunit Rpc82 [Xylogone sp. PMI_703]